MVFHVREPLILNEMINHYTRNAIPSISSAFCNLNVFLYVQKITLYCFLKTRDFKNNKKQFRCRVKYKYKSLSLTSLQEQDILLHYLLTLNEIINYHIIVYGVVICRFKAITI